MRKAFFICALFCSRAVVLEFAFLLAVEACRVTLLGATTVGYEGPLISSTSLVDVDSNELSSSFRSLVSYLKKGARSSSYSTFPPHLCPLLGLLVLQPSSVPTHPWLELASKLVLLLHIAALYDIRLQDIWLFEQPPSSPHPRLPY